MYEIKQSKSFRLILRQSIDFGLLFFYRTWNFISTRSSSSFSVSTAGSLVREESIMKLFKFVSNIEISFISEAHN